MAGGTFVSGQEKTRPGFYTRYTGSGKVSVGLTNTGVIMLPLIDSKWGTKGDVINITSNLDDEQFFKLGYDLSHSAMLLVREALKEATTVLGYVLNTGSSASVTAGNLTLTLKQAGARGNDFYLIVKTNVISGFDVEVYVENTQIYKATGVATVADLPSSIWFTKTGTGALTATAKSQFAGGSSNAIVNSDITEFLSNCELYNFKTLAFPFDDSTLQAAFLSQIRYLRQEIGKNVIGVSANFDFDYPYIINVTNGVKLSNGTLLSAKQSVAWVAGARAAAGYLVDITHKQYVGAIDANPRLTNEQIIQGLKTGHFMFTTVVEGASTNPDENIKVRVEEDLNSFHTFTSDWGEDYTDNKFIATLDAIADLGSQLLVPNKYPNNVDGIKHAEQDMLNLLEDLEREGAIQGIDPETDVIADTVRSTGKSLYLTVGAQPVRTFKKYYVTIQTA
jgi:hypothetical protein